MQEVAKTTYGDSHSNLFHIHNCLPDYIPCDADAGSLHRRGAMTVASICHSQTKFSDSEVAHFFEIFGYTVRRTHSAWCVASSTSLRGQSPLGDD